MVNWSEIGKSLRETANKAKEAIAEKFSKSQAMPSPAPPAAKEKSKWKKVAGAAAAGSALAGAALKKTAAAGAAAERKKETTEWSPKKTALLILIVTGAIILYTLTQKININAFVGFVLMLGVIAIGIISMFYPKFGKQLAGWGVLLLACYASYYFLRNALTQEIAGVIALILLATIGLYKAAPRIGGPVLAFMGVVLGLLLGTMILSILPLGLPAMFIPIFIIVYFIMVIAATPKKWIFRILFIAVTVSTIFYINMTYPAFVKPGSPMYKAFEGQQRAWLSIGETIGIGVTKGIPKVAEKIGTEIERQYLYATGQYEIGIEESQGKPLGVFLEHIQVTPSKVPLDGKVTALAHLRATALEGESFNVKVECKAGEEKGTVKPISNFNVQQHEERDLVCGIDAVNVGRGTTPVTMKATFDFTTGAFLKTYFMRQQTIRAIRQRGIENPLDEFNIAEKNPFAKFSPGPVRIGMGLTQPVALLEENEEGSEYGPLLQITLEKNWQQGKIQKLHELKITAPPGIKINEVNGYEVKNDMCTSKTAPGSPEKQEETTCTLNEEFLEKIFPEGTQLETFAVTTKIDSTDEVMQIKTEEGTFPQQLAIRNFKAEAHYTYAIEQSAPVTITKPRIEQQEQP